MSVTAKSASCLKHVDFMAIDLIGLVVAFIVAYGLKFGELSFAASSSSWRGLLLMLLLLDVTITLFITPYSGVFRRSYWEDVGHYLQLALWIFLAACLVFYLLKIGEDYSREMLLTTIGIYLAVSILAKAAWKHRLLHLQQNRPADSARRVVLVADPDAVESAEANIVAEDMNVHEVVGYCVTNDSSFVAPGGKPAGGLRDIARIAAMTRADDVLIAIAPGLVEKDAYEELVEDGIRVCFAISESLGIDSEQQFLGRIGIIKTLDLERYDFGGRQVIYLLIKRLFDIVFGIIGCVFVLLAACFIKIAYLANGDYGRIMYKQVRVGLRGQEFSMWKFRSMVRNADEVLGELLKDPVIRREWERDQKLENDPRVTSVGRILRKTSLDELPQFINVLKGEMSLVGPRPLVSGELEEHGGRPLYNKVKPGVTGWWGCNGRSNIEYRERLELEYHYVKHCSLYLDIVCIFRTFVAVLKKEGAR